jgi:hypothetical protein
LVPVGLFRVSLTAELGERSSFPVRALLGADRRGRPGLVLEQHRGDRWESRGLIAWRPSTRAVRCETTGDPTRSASCPAPGLKAVLDSSPEDAAAVMAALVEAGSEHFGIGHVPKGERSWLLPLLFDGLSQASTAELWEPPRRPPPAAKRTSSTRTRSERLASVESPTVAPPVVLADPGSGSGRDPGRGGGGGSRGRRRRFLGPEPVVDWESYLVDA